MTVSLDIIAATLEKLSERGLVATTETCASDLDMAAAAHILSVEAALEASESANLHLAELGACIQQSVVEPLRALLKKNVSDDHLERIGSLLTKLVRSVDSFRCERQLIPVYGEILSLCVLTLERMNAPGQENHAIRLMLKNIAVRKAADLSESQAAAAYASLGGVITISIIAKRYAVYVTATRGFCVLFRGEIDFKTHGTSPEALALQITNLCLKHGVRLSEITDIVCGGGDLGVLPDGIYVLTQKVRDESRKRLHNSSLNRSALVAWEMREILSNQSNTECIHSSLCSPLSFTTLGAVTQPAFLREESAELRQSLRGHVKVTPLKALAAIFSEILNIHQEKLNMVVLTLDELFASAVRKTGPRILRELAAQEANQTLINFDFDKIVEKLREENFVIPPHFRLASRQIGTGVKEICELLMITDSGSISEGLAQSLMHVVDCYARQVAAVLERASAGAPDERPHFTTVTSSMALDPYFRTLFHKIRIRVDSPFTPIMCLPSLEHEYLIANHLFELYINPARGDRRLHFSVEVSSITHALQVLGSGTSGGERFSFTGLMGEVTEAIRKGKIHAANLLLVGADNKEALLAAANAREYGLVNKLVLLGDPTEIADAIQESKVGLSPGNDPGVEILAIDPLAVTPIQKKTSMGETLRTFLEGHGNYVVMKGSIDSSILLHQALAIYREEVNGQVMKKIASNTAIFVLPGGRLFVLSDAAVNPSFKNADALVSVIENQLDVVRKIVDPGHLLKVAVITAVEKQTSAIPATLLAAEAQERAKKLEDKYGPLIVEGPLSFDLATVPEVSEEKHYEGKIRGDANCFVATDINTANVLYKMLSKTMGSLGLFIQNGSVITAGPGTSPLVLNSRGDTAQTQFNSLLLALAYASPVIDRRSGENEQKA